MDFVTSQEFDQIVDGFQGPSEEIPEAPEMPEAFRGKSGVRLPSFPTRKPSTRAGEYNDGMWYTPGFDPQSQQPPSVSVQRPNVSVQEQQPININVKVDVSLSQDVAQQIAEQIAPEIEALLAKLQTELSGAFTQQAANLSKGLSY